MERIWWVSRFVTHAIIHVALAIVPAMLINHAEGLGRRFQVRWFSRWMLVLGCGVMQLRGYVGACINSPDSDSPLALTRHINADAQRGRRHRHGTRNKAARCGLVLNVFLVCNSFVSGDYFSTFVSFLPWRSCRTLPHPRGPPLDPRLPPTCWWESRMKSRKKGKRRKRRWGTGQGLASEAAQYPFLGLQ